MIKLTERQNNIIRDLMNQIQPITIGSLGNKLNVSERTIRYDLDAIEYWLKLKNIKLMKKPNVGIWINMEQETKNEIIEELETTEKNDLVLSIKNRQDMILLLILLSTKPVPAQFIADIMEISRNTVISDLKILKTQFEKYDIRLNSKTKYGFYIIGNEKEIRNLIKDLLITNSFLPNLISINENKNEKLNLMKANNIFKFINEAFKEINIKDIKNAVNESKKYFDFWMSDVTYRTLLLEIMIILARAKAGNQIEPYKDDDSNISRLDEYKVAQIIGDYLSKTCSVILSENEIINIFYILFNNDFKLKQIKPFMDNNESEALGNAVDEMVSIAKNYLLNDQEIMDKLKVDLLSHMGLTLKKYKMNIHSSNPLLEEIKKTYSEEFVIAKKMVDSFSNRVNIQLGEDEIGYVTIILVAQAESGKRSTQKKVLIVCTTGQGSAKILYQKIRNKVPELNILGTNSVFEIEDHPELIEQADAIISTVYFKTKDIPLIKVSAFISEEDIVKIKNFAYEGKSNNYYKEAQQEEYILCSIMDIVDQYVSIENRAKLKFKLSSLINYFHENFTTITNVNGINEKHAGKIAMIVIEIQETLNELFKKKIIKEEGKNLFGIIIHIIMSVHRWESGDYSNDIDTEEYRTKNPEMFEVIKNHLTYISKCYGLDIPNSEVIYIMRYLI